MLGRYCLQLVLVAIAATLLPKRAQAVATTNPFKRQTFYVNPSNFDAYKNAIVESSGIVRENLIVMQRVPSAYWIDAKAKIKGSSTLHMEGILQDAASKPTPELVVLILYNLPNRDCNGEVSTGEICCTYTALGLCDYSDRSDCSAGIEEYKTTYVDPIMKGLKAYQDQVPIVIIMEPDSLANIATNSANPHCRNPATRTAYTEGIKYAINQLTSQTPKVTVYLDGAHGGWLGWESNLMKFMSLLSSMHLPLNKIRGFATNIANYQPLGTLCPYCPDQGYRNEFCLSGKHHNHSCCEDHCKLTAKYSFGNNELNYAAGLVAAAHGELGMTAHVVTDTGRNGSPDQRQSCANQCNIRGAGAGVPSTAETADPGVLDAYYWLKPPGESDGCTNMLPNGSLCLRFAVGCASEDSLGWHLDEDLAPEAGRWYDFQAKQLAANARFSGQAPEREAAQGRCNEAPPPQPHKRHPRRKPPNIPSSSGQCGTAYSQCGGLKWNGTLCCEAGCQCNSNDDSFHQCMPLDPRGGSCTPPRKPVMLMGSYRRAHRGLRGSTKPQSVSGMFLQHGLFSN